MRAKGKPRHNWDWHGRWQMRYTLHLAQDKKKAVIKAITTKHEGTKADKRQLRQALYLTQDKEKASIQAITPNHDCKGTDKWQMRHMLHLARHKEKPPYKQSRPTMIAKGQTNGKWDTCCIWPRDKEKAVVQAITSDYDCMKAGKWKTRHMLHLASRLCRWTCMAVILTASANAHTHKDAREPIIFPNFQCIAHSTNKLVHLAGHSSLWIASVTHWGLQLCGCWTALLAAQDALCPGSLCLLAKASM